MKKQTVLANKILSRIQYVKLPYRKQKRYCGNTNEIVVFTLDSLQTLNLAMEICLARVKKVIAVPAIFHAMFKFINKEQDVENVHF